MAGSAQRLQIAVRNLLDNAAKFGPPGAPVEVGMLAGELTVRDHGPGIPPADLPGVFDRFYRAASVRAEPAPGGGTLIRLRLTGPTSRASAAQAGAVTVAVPELGYHSRR